MVVQFLSKHDDVAIMMMLQLWWCCNYDDVAIMMMLQLWWCCNYDGVAISSANMTFLLGNLSQDSRGQMNASSSVIVKTNSALSNGLS